MYSSISSKIYIVKKIMSGSAFSWGVGRDQNLQICHAATSATRVNQGVEPWVSQRPLASKLCLHPVEFSVKSLGNPGITWSRICARFGAPFGIDDVQTVGA